MEAETACNPVTSLFTLHLAVSANDKASTRLNKRNKPNVFNPQTAVDNSRLLKRNTGIQKKLCQRQQTVLWVPKTWSHCEGMQTSTHEICAKDSILPVFMITAMQTVKTRQRQTREILHNTVKQNQHLLCLLTSPAKTNR